MGRVGAALIALAAVAGTIAYACAGDGGAGPGSWNPQQSSAILSPANDTRSNLLLLLADRYGTPVAHPAAMAKGIVPIDFPWSVMRSRLSPPKSDEERWSSTWSEVETSRCHSNEAAAAAFAAALSAERDVPAEEKRELQAAREQLKAQCMALASGQPDAGSNPALETVDSSDGRAFATYLTGARLFYAGSFAEASATFRSLAGVSQPWVRESSADMAARTALNEAQQSSFDEYGDLAAPKDRNQEAIRAAGLAFRAYLAAYPRGIYAGSANGLLRRVAWLAGDEAALGSAYSAMIAGPSARAESGADLALIQELDNKLLPDGRTSGVTDPTLLAVIDLMRLRQDGREENYILDYRGARLERAELERQRPNFRSDPALFDYLLAVEAFYGRKKPQEVLALIPDAANQQRFTYVQFSRQMLRGFALEAVKDRNARGFWLSLLPGAVQPYQREAVELALAEHDRKAGQIAALFAPGSPLRHALIRQRLLEDSAGPALLRQQAKSAPTAREREVALHLLLAGELHHGMYAEFVRDVTLVGPRPAKDETDQYQFWSVANFDADYNDELSPPPLHLFAAGGSDDLAPCPDIRSTAAMLAADPAAIRPRLCLAEFIRRKGFDGWGETYDAEYNRVTRSRGFAGRPLERIDVYRAVIASPAASADDKAFALNRAVRCFAPSGTSSCGGADIPVEQRRAWFTQLKRDHPNSPWARDLKFYW